jgi:hypothetical protein
MDKVHAQDFIMLLRDYLGTGNLGRLAQRRNTLFASFWIHAELAIANKMPAVSANISLTSNALFSSGIWMISVKRAKTSPATSAFTHFTLKSRMIAEVQPVNNKK